ncbi:hypothetical protein CEXT_561021 [Caerostris extrusa]|uniref:Sulfotransferase domain-containing protein n=1 Tax=Caerostris extrusa TaxID=172846 RepID=A0AAV4SSL3_CAEEX|nr:hypothetical protein CEXT_561021 [Caerostris extrusa]
MAENRKPKGSRYVQLVRGYPFPGSAFFKKDILEEVMDYVPKSGDIIISSYPKTGTTWLQYIVLQIISKGTLFPSSEDLDRICPYMEMTGKSSLDLLKPPRMYMHHIPYNMMQKNKESKVLYIYRRPEDTFVSYYHFLQNLREDNLDFDEYFENFLSGNVGYGRYFDHIMSYLAHRDDGNLLLISYEALSANNKEEILRIARFLGEDYYRNLTQDESVLDEIIKRTSFDYMKSNISVTIPIVRNEDECEKLKPKKINFFRKGIVGEGKCLLSSEQMNSLKNEAEVVMGNSEILQAWVKE